MICTLIVCTTILVLHERYHSRTGTNNNLELRFTDLDNKVSSLASSSFDQKEFTELKAKVDVLRLSQGLRAK